MNIQVRYTGSTNLHITRDETGRGFIFHFYSDGG